jgi:glutaredoxin
VLKLLFSNWIKLVRRRRWKKGGYKLQTRGTHVCCFCFIDDGAAIQDYLQKKTGQRTVPNVFVAQQHVGGNSDVQAANSNGSLEKLLA